MPRPYPTFVPMPGIEYPVTVQDILARAWQKVGDSPIQDAEIHNFISLLFS